jgi:hypothetical protein
MQGAAADTVLQDRIDYMVEAAKDFEKRGCKKQDADMRLAVFQTRKNPNPLSLINIGILYTQTDQLLKADSIFSVYTQLSPDSILGHYWRGRVNASIDTSQKQEPFVTNMVTGFTKALDIAGTDKPRYRNLGITSALSLIGYYYNVKADKDAALVQVYKGLEFDTSHAQLKGIKETLERKTPVRQQGGGTQKPSNNPPKASGAKPEATNPKSGAASGTKR